MITCRQSLWLLLAVAACARNKAPPAPPATPDAAGSNASTPPPAVPAASRSVYPAAEEADPRAYKVLLSDRSLEGSEREVESFRLLDLTLAKGATTPLHQLPDHVIAALAPGALQFTSAEGKTTRLELTAGEAVFQPAQVRSVENVGDTEVRVLVLELLPATMGSWGYGIGGTGTTRSARDDKTDPVTIAPGNYRVILDHAEVRLLAATFDKGDRIGKHAHPSHAIYVVSGGTLTIQPEHGNAERKDLVAGTAIEFGPGTHSERNVGKTKIELLVFEHQSPP